MDLSRISNEAKRQILSKMNLPTLVRARKTNKYINSFAEKNGIVANLTNAKLLLKISASPKQNTQNQANPEFDLSFSVFVHNTERSPLCIKYYIENLDSTRINDPVKQLSGVRFHQILMIHNRFENNLLLDRGINEKKLRVFEELPEIFKKFKLSTKRLIVDSETYHIPQWKKSNDLITKAKLVYFLPESIESIDDISVPYFGSVHAHINKIPTKTPQFIRHLRGARIYFSDQVTVNEVDGFIKNFLLEIISDRRVRGRLDGAVISMTYREPTPLENFPGMVDVWHGVHKDSNPGKPATISKLKIDGGFAYLIYYGGYRMMFYDEEDDKEAILDIKAQIDIVEREQA